MSVEVHAGGSFCALGTLDIPEEVAGLPDKLKLINVTKKWVHTKFPQFPKKLKDTFGNTYNI